ncbi:hypothetical protein [Azospirillum palustre]
MLVSVTVRRSVLEPAPSSHRAPLMVPAAFRRYSAQSAA